MTTYPPVAPAVLRWARSAARRMSGPEAASKLKISESQLRAYESGEERPNLTTVRRMCSVYQVQFAALLMPEPPNDMELPSDYRTIGGLGEDLSVDTIAAIRDSISKREALSDIISSTEILDIPELATAEVSPKDDPEQLASATRERLGYSDADQLTWRDARESFNSWRDRLEHLGVYTFVQSMPRSDCRGFSLCGDDDPPVIVVNSTEVYQARTFTLFHEYGHILLRESALCNATGSELGNVESFCNRFAASVVMPSSAVHMAIESENITEEPSEWTLSEVASVARRLKVGRPALAIRLSDLGYTVGNLYARVASLWEAESWRPERDRESKGGPKPEVRIVNQWGVSFTRTVMRAFDAGVIGEADVCSALGARSQHLADVWSFVDTREPRHQGRS